MFNYQKHEIVSLARENGFKSETLEKVLRLVDVLEFINTNDDISMYLVLKGGTAINLAVFDLPRLSVDIDLDLSFNGSKEEMLEKRKEITMILKRYMEINGYIYSNESRNTHALDSFVFNYYNNFGNKDNLKIEINYMNRVHIYPLEKPNLKISFLRRISILMLNKYELFGSKIKALLERCTIRDVYDVYYMINSKIFKESELELVKKCTIFYMAIGATTNRTFKEVIDDFNMRMNIFFSNRIPQYLSATLRNIDNFNMESAAILVRDFINSFLILTETEEKFLNEFYNKRYNPSLLFNDEIVKRISNHPMALWKCMVNN